MPSTTIEDDAADMTLPSLSLPSLTSANTTEVEPEIDVDLGWPAHVRAHLEAETDGDIRGMQEAIQRLMSRVGELETEATRRAQAEPRESGEDGDKDEDLYSFCLEMLIFPDTTVLACTHSLRLLALTTVEIVLSFGFFDASWLMCWQGNTNLLGGPIAESTFYPSSSIAYEAEGNAVPLINVLTSLAGMICLCQVMHKDNVTSLKSMPPILMPIYWLLDGESFTTQRTTTQMKTSAADTDATTDPGASASQAHSHRAIGPWQVIACILLQVEFTIRCIYLPVTSSLGTALSLASANSAQVCCLCLFSARCYCIYPAARSRPRLWLRHLVARVRRTW